MDELKAEDTEESRARVENIDELISKTVSYEETMKAENREATLSGFLEEIALIADIDSVDENQDYVVLMTLHSAKGLEFPYVYLAGMEDGMFPSSMCIFSGDQSELEEERRLCYVGITRAMKELTMTSAQQRMVRGETQYNRVSQICERDSTGTGGSWTYCSGTQTKDPGDKISAQQLSADEEKLPYEGISAAEF